MLRLLACKALLGTRLDGRLGFGNPLEPLLAPGQFLGNRHAVRHIRLFGRLGKRHQFLHLGLQLRLDLARTRIRQRAVPAGIGLHLGAVQCHGSHLQHSSFPGQHQNIGEPFCDHLVGNCSSAALNPGESLNDTESRLAGRLKSDRRP